MSYTDLNYHVIFSTKERAALITDELRPRLIKYVGGIVRELKGSLIEANSPADHFHLAASVPPTITISDFVGKIKSNSCGWIHNTFPGSQGFWWQEGYAAFTVSHSGVQDVVAYIQGQLEHHRRWSFQDELVTFLKKHGVRYDERYIWA